MMTGCLVLAVLAVSPAWGVCLLWVRETTGRTADIPWFGLWSISVVGLFIILLPIGVAARGTLARLHDYVESAGTRTSSTIPGGPFWLRPVLRTFVQAIEQFRQRERDLRNQHRDLEIQHHVASAERRQIEAVLGVMSEAVVVTNAFDEIVLANQAAGRLFGFDPEVAHRIPIEQLIKDESLQGIVHETKSEGNFVECRQLEHRLEGLPSRGDEAGPDCDISLACVSDHRDQVAAVVTIIRDRTREREISQMKSEFVSKASHELRTPLASVRAYVEMLVDGEAEDEASRNEFYRIIQGETERLTRLVDNMLNISRIESGIVHVDRDHVDMGAVVEQALATIEPHAREKDITLHRTIAPVDLHVTGDRDMLSQVVVNLLSNAVKYTPQGGRITLKIDSDNLARSIHVSVADTGLGIPPQDQERIFEKFFRIENYKRVAEGTGLGLNLCRHIVETVHRGTIGLESELGMGSRFWFSIPMEREERLAA